MTQVVDAPRGRVALAGVLLAGCAVALALGIYAKEHTPVPRPLFLAGFSGALQFKTWFATIALLFVLVQVATALWMWGRLPGTSAIPSWVGPTHRWSGTVAFVVLIPVALRVRGLPGWLLPLLGGLVFTAFLVLWFTSAAWFFTSSGRPLR